MGVVLSPGVFFREYIVVLKSPKNTTPYRCRKNFSEIIRKVRDR